MRRGTIIAGLICLNLGLLAGLAYVWKNRAPGVEGSPPSGGASPDESGTPSKTITRRIHVPAGRPETPSRFTWRFIESSDFKQYIANLRAVGCPEQTIQDIVIAEVNKLYAGKEAALRLRPEHLKPWEVFAVSTRVAMDRERKLRQLLREKRALLKELLGIDVPVEMPSALSGGVASREARFEKAYQNLPEGKRDLVRAIQEQYWDKSEELETRIMGFWEKQDYEEAVRLRAELRSSLAKTLTPDELLDYDIGTSSNASRYRSELAAVNVSDQEFRELFKARHAIDEEFNTGLPNDPDSARKRAEARRMLEESMKSVLGEQRYADYQRSRDSQFRNLARLAQETGLSSETAIKAWDVQRLARDESNKLRANPDLPPEQRDQMMRQMQAELDATMTQLLGKEAFDRFQQNYGGARIFYERGTATFRPAPSPVAPGPVILAP